MSAATRASDFDVVTPAANRMPANPVPANRTLANRTLANRTPVRKMMRWLDLWYVHRERARQRRQLRVLAANPHFLADLGISKADAIAESERPFWR